MFTQDGSTNNLALLKYDLNPVTDTESLELLGDFSAIPAL